MNDILKYDKNDSDNYYKILGCDQSSSREQIITEYKNRALLLHPDKRHDSQESDESFKKLVKAKDVLTDSVSRKLFDKWLNSGIAVSFDKWSQMGKGVQTSMHWINKSSNTGLMLDNGQTSQPNDEYCSLQSFRSQSVKRFWNNDYNNDMITKFRNYHI